MAINGNATEMITEGLKNQVLNREPGSVRQAASNKWISKGLMEGWKEGLFEYKDLDLPQIFHDTFMAEDERFANAVGLIESGEGFMKSRGHRDDIYEALSLSQFGDFVNSCVRMGTFEMCSGPDFAPILSQFERKFVGCVNLPDYTMPQMADFDVPCVTEDERTETFGIGDLVKRCMPEPEEKRFSMALKRNMVCLGEDFEKEIRDQGAYVLRLHVLRQMVRLMFDTYCPGTNPYRMCYDDMKYDNFLACGCGPWANQVYNNVDFNCACQHPAITAIEELAEDMRNPLTGAPMTCCDNLTVFSPSQKQARYIRELLGPHLAKRGLGAAAPTCDSCEVSVSSRDGWGSIFTDRWLRKEVYDTLCAQFGVGGTLGTNFTEEQLKQMLERTFVAGCPREFAGWQVRWDTEVAEYSGTDTHQYHTENIIFRLTWSEYTGPFTKNPWAMFKSYGVHDGATIPTDCSHPVCP